MPSFSLVQKFSFKGCHAKTALPPIPHVATFCSARNSVNPLQHLDKFNEFPSLEQILG
jgi:hypothetical protein